MNYLKEKVAYLKGLAEGMQISDATNEGKLLKAIIDVLDDFAIVVDDIDDTQMELIEEMDELDEDLAEVEKIVYGEDYYEEVDEDDEEDEEEDEPSSEFECPHCGEVIVLEEAFINKDAILCPHCKKEIEIEWATECEDCIDSEDEDENGE